MLAALDKVQTSLTLFSFAQHLAVEIRNEPLLASKSLVDEQVLFVLSHGVAKIYILHAPAMPFKLMHNYPMKVLVVHGIVRAKSCGIIVIDDTVVGMRRIVCAEVCNERSAGILRSNFGSAVVCSGLRHIMMKYCIGTSSFV